MRSHLILAAYLLAFACGTATAADIMHGRIVAVLDGDTVTLLDRGQVQHRIRLSQIDAPEIGHGRNKPGQPFGQASKQSLAELVYGRDTLADCETEDRYGRQVCTLWVGSTNANLEQVRRGMAWVYRKYARDPAYYRAEDDARAEKRGLWGDANAMPPWVWRHRGMGHG